MLRPSSLLVHNTALALMVPSIVTSQVNRARRFSECGQSRAHLHIHRLCWDETMTGIQQATIIIRWTSSKKRRWLEALPSLWQWRFDVLHGNLLVSESLRRQNERAWSLCSESRALYQRTTATLPILGSTTNFLGWATYRTCYNYNLFPRTCQKCSISRCPSG